MEQLLELLRALGSANKTNRQQAEGVYKQAEADAPEELVRGLVAVIASEAKESLRRHAAVLLRQLVGRVYFEIRAASKRQLADDVLRAFEKEALPSQQRKIGEVIAKLAEYVDSDGVGWPELLPLVLKMANSDVSQRAESAIRLLMELVHSMNDRVVGFLPELGHVLQRALGRPPLRRAAFLLVCEILGECEKTVRVALRSTGPTLESVLQELRDEALIEALQAYIQVVANEPEFFEPRMRECAQPATLLAGLVKSQSEASVRILSLEWIVSYIEKGTYAPACLPGVALDACMHMMLEADEDLNAWSLDGESDELFEHGKEAIDRVVDASGMGGGPLLELIVRYASFDWRGRLSSLTAIRQTAEYLEEQEQVNGVTGIVLQSVEHPHPRVRYSALHALGQLANDQAPSFQETWHATVMPVLLTMMDDPVDRVSAMALSAFASFGEKLHESLMGSYAPGFMEKLVVKLHSAPRVVQEEAITAVAVIAGSVREGFVAYYDGIMPMLKHFVADDGLRGKSFECMSLLGIAVGKDKFLPDAREAVAMMACGPDDQKHYVQEAYQRVAQCLKHDFKPFVPSLLPAILQPLSLKDAAQGDIEVVTAGEVHWLQSAHIQEMMSSTSLLSTFCSELEGAFLDWVPETAEALLPLLTLDSTLCEVRQHAMLVWALLIKSAVLGSASKELPRHLLRKAVQLSFGFMNEDESTAGACRGLADCITNAGPGVLSSEEVTQLASRLFNLIDDSLRLGVGKRCLLYQGVLSALVHVSPKLPWGFEHIRSWLGRCNTLALNLLCDLLQLPGAEAVWDLCAPTVLSCLAEEAEASAAACAIKLAAALPNFVEVPAAFRALAALVGAKNTPQARVASDNAVAALLRLFREKPALCPAEVPVWGLIVSRLPLCDDPPAAREAHAAIAQLVLEQHPQLLGPQQAHLGVILSALAEVHGEASCSREAEAKIVELFRSIAHQTLQACASCFSEKQQKKIMKIVCET